MAWTEAELASLKAAVASGVLRVRYDGPPAREITYQSLSEMRELLAEMEGSVSAASGSGTSYRFAATRKGL
jgi:hypothetical protein